MAARQPYSSVPGGQNASNSTVLTDKAGHSAAAPAAAPAKSGGLSTAAKVGIALGAIAVLAIALGVGLGVGLNNDDSSSSASSSRDGGNGGNGGSTEKSGGTCEGSAASLKGGDGDTVRLENGTTFVYRNTFGGTWTAVPYDDSAKAQSFTPSLAEKWDYETMRIMGVNMGGWLVLEPFISPGMFEDYTNRSVVDEWTLSAALLADDSTGKARDDYLENHYRTFITEEDFARVAGAGLNWVRLPVPFWMVEKYSNEPYVTNTITWKYFVKALDWSRKYGLRVCLDLHSVPGSANGWNHGGRLQYGPTGINWMNGPMGIANAQRGASIVMALTEFVSSREYKNVVPMFSPLNEPYGATIGAASLDAAYSYLYTNMRRITGLGEGNGPVILFHDGFLGADRWNAFLPNADRVAFDNHPYFAFDTQTNDPMSVNAMKPCNAWANRFNTSMNSRGIWIGGEYSGAINDCSLWLNNIGLGNRYEGSYPDNVVNATRRTGSCDIFNNYPAYTDDFKQGLSNLIATSMDAMHNSFFWTWRIGATRLTAPLIPNPFWSYSLGLENGWINPDPRGSIGACARVAAEVNLPAAQVAAFSAFPSAAATGGAGAEQGVPASALSAFPPASLGNLTGPFPQYTATRSPFEAVSFSEQCTPSGGSSVDLTALQAVPTPTATQGGYAAMLTGTYTPIANCQYPDQWRAGQTGVTQPSPVCGAAGGARKRGLVMEPTRAPVKRGKWD